MDDESVAFAATPDGILSPLSPLSCSWLAVGGVPRCCSAGISHILLAGWLRYCRILSARGRGRP
jgi:hypothetical protein